MLPQFVDWMALASKSTIGSIFNQAKTKWSIVTRFNKAPTSSMMSKIASIKKWAKPKVVDFILKWGSLAWQSNSLVDFSYLVANIRKYMVIQSYRNQSGPETLDIFCFVFILSKSRKIDLHRDDKNETPTTLGLCNLRNKTWGVWHPLPS